MKVKLRETPKILSLTMAALVTAWAVPSQGADHVDSPAVIADPTADITDVFSWMSADASKLHLVMNVVPFATPQSKFSDAVQYVFTVNSGSGYGDTPEETKIIAQFDADGNVQLWVGDKSYLTGDASDPAGISNEQVRVFTGLRNDPFVFNFEGFTDTAKFVKDNVATLAPLLDGAGCPVLDETLSGAVVGLLTQTAQGTEPAKDFFAGANVLSIALELDKTLVNAGGDILAVWGSTHTR